MIFFDSILLIVFRVYSYNFVIISLVIFKSIDLCCSLYSIMVIYLLRVLYPSMLSTKWRVFIRRGTACFILFLDAMTPLIKYFITWALCLFLLIYFEFIYIWVTLFELLFQQILTQWSSLIRLTVQWVS